jgi:hypothetical protein
MYRRRALSIDLAKLEVRWASRTSVICERFLTLSPHLSSSARVNRDKDPLQVAKLAREQVGRIVAERKVPSDQWGPCLPFCFPGSILRGFVWRAGTKAFFDAEFPAPKNLYKLM